MEDTDDYADHLAATVTRAAARLASVSNEDAARRPTPDKWSAKEIIGHLIDSAANNHQRFVRASWQDDLVFDGYAQEAWVRVQDYQAADWRELLTLWASYNRHLAHVMRSVPESVRLREHRVHNLHDVAWQAIPAGEPATLDYFMRDYVGHLEHHLRQIDALHVFPSSPKS